MCRSGDRRSTKAATLAAKVKIADQEIRAPADYLYMRSDRAIHELPGGEMWQGFPDRIAVWYANPLNHEIIPEG